MFGWGRGARERFQLVVTNIGSCSEAELREVFVPFRRDAEVELVERMGGNGSLRRYGLVTFHSERKAQKAIEKLSHKTLHGHHLQLREYQTRSYGNERRALGWRNKRWDGEERRADERRLAERGQPIDDFDRWLMESEAQEAELKLARENLGRSR